MFFFLNLPYGRCVSSPHSSILLACITVEFEGFFGNYVCIHVPYPVCDSQLFPPGIPIFSFS